MPYNKYLQIPIERYDILCQRYEKFTESLDDGNTKPVKLFDALNEKQLQELVLIRDVSLDLQKKRDEDIRKAAQQAAEAEQKAKEIAAQEAAAAAEAAADAATDATPAEA